MKMKKTKKWQKLENFSQDREGNFEPRIVEKDKKAYIPNLKRRS